MSAQFYKFICRENVLQPKVSEILANFLAENEKNYVLLRNSLSQYKNIFQYVYSNEFPEVYCAMERRGFDLKSTFCIVFKTYKDKKKLKNWEKNLQNYKNTHAETLVFEQKPIKISMKPKKKRSKSALKKEKMKRREVAEKNKLLKKKKKTREK